MLPFVGLFNVQPPSTANPNWADISWNRNTNIGTITSKQLGYGVTLKVVNLVDPSSIELYYQVSAAEVTGDITSQPSSPWTQVAATPGSTFAVTSGQWVSFTCYSSAGFKISSQTVEVRNDSDNALIDTFTIQVTE